MGLVHQSNAFLQAPFAWNILLAAFPPGRHPHHGPLRTNSGYVSAVALNKPGTLENWTEMGRPVLKQGCCIGKLWDKWYSPASSKAAELENWSKNGRPQT